MRLLDTRTGQFRWIEDPQEVRYAILSHVWAKNDDLDYVPEQTYQDICKIQSCADGGTVLSQLSDKIRNFCAVALEDGYELAWADSCCIDKTSSTELASSIDAMYSWYCTASACYVFMHDVDSSHSLSWDTQFRDSKWFTRGWTLQELIAPKLVFFYARNWDLLGTKVTLSSKIESTTLIERAVLTSRRAVEDVSFAARMSWAALRSTTRVEDEAYSLMGILGVRIPINYGEGRRAFVRLQTQILEMPEFCDHTIFAWKPFLRNWNPFTHSGPQFSDPNPPADLPPTSMHGLLAASPRDFVESSQLECLSREDYAAALGISSHHLSHLFQFRIIAEHIHACLPLVSVELLDHAVANVPTHIALLGCKDSRGKVVGLLLRSQPGSSESEYVVGTIIGPVSLATADLDRSHSAATRSLPQGHYYRGTYLGLDANTLYRVANVSIPCRGPEDFASTSLLHEKLCDAGRSFRLSLSPISSIRKALSLKGFTFSPPDGRVTVNIPGNTLSSTHPESNAAVMVISSSAERFTVQIGRCHCEEYGTRYDFLGFLVSSQHSQHPFELPGVEAGTHPIDHPVHFHSWRFDPSGFASNNTLLVFQSGERYPATLTLSHSMSKEDLYCFSIEIAEDPLPDTLDPLGLPQSSMFTAPPAGLTGLPSEPFESIPQLAGALDTPPAETFTPPSTSAGSIPVALPHMVPKPSTKRWQFNFPRSLRRMFRKRGVSRESSSGVSNSSSQEQAPSTTTAGWGTGNSGRSISKWGLRASSQSTVHPALATVPSLEVSS